MAMIFRAIFWIGLVALLMPHEPDLGYGRPDSVTTGVTSEIAAWTKDNVPSGLKDPASLCRYDANACAASAGLLGNIKDMAVHSLGEIRSQIEESRRARSTGG
jgi:hypothetical protein